MRSLARVVKQGLQAGEAIPSVYQKFEQAGILFRKGDVHMITGEPNQGKTFLALNLAMRNRVPTLYFSNDSSETTVASRVISYLTKTDSRIVERELAEKQDLASELLAQMDHIRWSFSAAPTLSDIEDELEGFRELYGEYPDQTFVDVLMQVNYAEESEHSSFLRIMHHLKLLARDRGTALIAVHHAREEEYPKANAPICPPLRATAQKVNHLTALCLSVANRGDNFYIAPVKSRGSKADPSGRTALTFRWDPAIATIEE